MGVPHEILLCGIAVVESAEALYTYEMKRSSSLVEADATLQEPGHAFATTLHVYAGDVLVTTLGNTDLLACG